MVRLKPLFKVVQLVSCLVLYSGVHTVGKLPSPKDTGCVLEN
jgi:hypothetical protein